MKYTIKYISGTMKHTQPTPPQKPKPPTIEWVNHCISKQDHIMGIYYDYEQTDLVKLSDKSWRFKLPYFEAFKFCPACGKNISKQVSKHTKNSNLGGSNK